MDSFGVDPWAENSRHRRAISVPGHNPAWSMKQVCSIVDILGQTRPNAIKLLASMDTILFLIQSSDVSLFCLRIGMASSMLATSAALAVTRMDSLRIRIHRTVLQCSYVIRSDVWNRENPWPKSSDPKSIYAIWWLWCLLLATSAR